MKLVEHREVLNREVSVPGRPDHEGVTFSSTNYLSTTVTIPFVRWADMQYPNQITVTVTPGGINDAEVHRD